MTKSPAVAGYIYAIHSPENLRHAKLGLSRKPDSRVRQLQTGNPHKLKLIWSFPCHNMAEMERAFHRPPASEARLEGLEAFVDSPEKFLSSQRGVECILANQFPDLDKYADDPAALESYIERNLKRS